MTGTVHRLSRVCVYCASSPVADLEYRTAAKDLGRQLAVAGIDLVYGGGSLGSMGAVADGALAIGGRVFGVLPRFMNDLEWGHSGLTELELVETMRERKHRMLENVDAVIALPGGIGTFEELFEAFSLKQLGLFSKPIGLLNTRNYFAPMIAMLEHAVEHRFMNDEHGPMWVVGEDAPALIDSLHNVAPWPSSPRKFVVAR